MKQLRLTINGTSEQLANLVGIIMRNQWLDIIGLEKSEVPASNGTHRTAPVPESAPTTPRQGGLVPRTRRPNGHRQKPSVHDKYKEDSRAVWARGNNGMPVFNIEATLGRLNLKKDELMGMTWKVGTLEHSLKMAVTKRNRDKEKAAG